MSCTHPRQPYPAEKSSAMPCAWPKCEDGWKRHCTLQVALKPPPIALSFMRSDEPVVNRIKRVEMERHEMVDIDTGETWYEWQVAR